jgi:hypothetical protein
VCNPEYYKKQRKTGTAGTDPVPEKSANDWLAEILKASGPTGKVDEVPEGWLTVAQISEMTKTAMSTINHKMIRSLQSGQVQRKKFRIKTDRQIIGVWHYYKA